MAAETVFDALVSDVFSVLGQTATYTPNVGAAVTCQVVVGVDFEPAPDGYSAKAAVTVTTLEAILSELGKAPERGETFLVGTTTYTVQYLKEQDQRCVKMAVK